MIVFDIETGPQAIESLRDRMPQFEAPSNFKDPIKIEAALMQKKLDWVERAALDATTGEVLAIGVLRNQLGEDQVEILAGTEREVIAAFLSIVITCGGGGTPLVGWNIFGFDLPFVMRRAWILGSALPQWMRSGRYWDHCFVDAMEVWSCGNKEQRVSLDCAAGAIGIGRKSGHGAEFAGLWRGSDDERAQALAYLENDLRLTARVAERILPESAGKGRSA